MRRELFDRQDEIEGKRNDLIADLETQLAQQAETRSLFTIKWELALCANKCPGSRPESWPSASSTNSLQKGWSLGAHFNLSGLDLSDAEVEEFAKLTVELAQILSCGTCGQIPGKQGVNHYECSCPRPAVVRILPLQLRWAESDLAAGPLCPPGILCRAGLDRGTSNVSRSRSTDWQDGRRPDHSLALARSCT
ncbi:MAG: hypothetical protein GVY22_04880 [Gammaproteobacteria bacterium]|jgi:hypothetical protein|nr:hypothetical protein [Gammaproteobacteria bacterium]